MILENTDLTAYKELVGKIPQLKKEIAKVIVGQESVIEEIIITLLAGGHCLLEGVPGLAKTLMVNSLSQGMDLNFKRIQFTPDLMPGDILGTEILEEDHETGKKFFQFNRGPIFANMVLADEINRTPPKTQAALLEAMQEKVVTYGGQQHSLPVPFLINATQNPIEPSGTYPLPETQPDRFLLYIQLGYPTEQEEIKVLTRTPGTYDGKPEVVFTGLDIQNLQKLTREVHIDSQLLVYINKLIRATRPDNSEFQAVIDYVEWGAGTRAGQALILCAKARELVKGRYAVTPEDIKMLAFPVLRHRLSLHFRAEAENIQPDAVITKIIEALPLHASK